ncbi:hypothetical protein QUF80_11800 [Desulfococcaceae bacterium HSG8]|nr:hypothetical protein [Desulfococcaceae bacterium HSG8]
MGKYVLIAIIALMLAFGLNYFGVIDVDWLDPPFSLEAKKDGAKKLQDQAKEALGE